MNSTFLLLIASLTFTFATALPKSIWVIEIDESPAPPPDQGPPLSAHALRDRSKLKYEVLGIVGAYLLWIAVTVVLIFIVGVRLRRKKQTSNRTLSMEMIKTPKMAPAPINTTAQDVEPSLKSALKTPSRLRSWLSPKSPKFGHKSEISVVSVSTVDESVIEADRARNMDEMAKLYAAVMAHNDKAPQKPRVVTHAESITPPEEDEISEMDNLRGARPAPTQLIHPLAPTPTDAEFPDYDDILPKYASRPTSHRQRPSNVSVRAQTISPPMGSPGLRDSSIYSDEVPLSPRLYSNPGPPPPIPEQEGQKTPKAATIDSFRKKAPSALSFKSGAASNSSHTLPFRQAYADSMASAPSTKTTFVERKLGINGPRTGVPQTPYSPYTPFTPMTPVTPRHLVTKQEMKRNRKQAAMKVVSEDDMVMSDEDMWGKMK